MRESMDGREKVTRMRGTCRKDVGGDNRMRIPSTEMISRLGRGDFGIEGCWRRETLKRGEYVGTVRNPNEGGKGSMLIDVMNWGQVRELSIIRAEARVNFRQQRKFVLLSNKRPVPDVGAMEDVSRYGGPSTRAYYLELWEIDWQVYKPYYYELIGEEATDADDEASDDESGQSDGEGVSMDVEETNITDSEGVSMEVEESNETDSEEDPKTDKRQKLSNKMGEKGVTQETKKGVSDKGRDEDEESGGGDGGDGGGE
jgi:hypothetical protein